MTNSKFPPPILYLNKKTGKTKISQGDFPDIPDMFKQEYGKQYKSDWISIGEIHESVGGFEGFEYLIPNHVGRYHTTKNIDTMDKYRTFWKRLKWLLFGADNGGI